MSPSGPLHRHGYRGTTPHTLPVREHRTRVDDSTDMNLGAVPYGRAMRAGRVDAVVVGCFAVCAVGCGRLGFRPLAEGVDGGGSASTDANDAMDSPDASADASTHTCNPGAPFGAPVAFTELDTAGMEGTLRLLPDELTGYFWSESGGPREDLRIATRADLDSPFVVGDVAGVNSATRDDVDPTIASDRSVLVFRRNDIDGDHIYVAPVIDAATFGPPTAVSTLNLANADSQPFLQPGGDTLLFISKVTGGGDVYASTRTGTSFSAPVQLTELATVSLESDPVLSADGRTVFFGSDRPGGSGLIDIYTATRATTAQPFGSPTVLASVSSAANEGPSWLSLDGCRLYLSSDRSGATTIYVATRGP